MKRFEIKLAVFWLVVLSSILFLASCRKPKIDSHYDKGWQTIRVDSGQHAQSPVFIPGLVVSRDYIDTGCIRVGEGMIYDLKGYHQINKVRGFKCPTAGTFNGSTPKKYAGVGWNYIPEFSMDSITYDSIGNVIDTIWSNKSRWQFYPYFNNYPDSAIVWPNDTLVVKYGGVVHFYRKWDKPDATIVIWTDQDTVSNTVRLGNYSTISTSGFWFGGRYASPVDIVTEIKD